MKFWSAERHRFEDYRGNQWKDEQGFSEECKGPDTLNNAREEGKARARDVVHDVVSPHFGDSMVRMKDSLAKVPSNFDNDPEAWLAGTEQLDKHYTDMKIQPMAFALANNLDPAQQTIVKYISRYRVKHGVRDLKAAAVVLEKYIAYVESGETEWDGQEA